MGDYSGYDSAIYSAMKQMSRNTASDFDSILGRRPTAPPNHLTRVLYVPHHVDGTSHIPLYNISETYQKAVGETPMGSSMYTVKVSGIKKPQGDGTDADVNFLVDFKSDQAGKTVAHVQRRTVTARSDDNGSSEIVIPTSENENFALNFSPSGSGRVTAPIATSYPIPPTIITKGAIEHPYFTFSLAEGPNVTTFQWQVHPVTDGLLRYTLVSVPVSSDNTLVDSLQKDKEPEIRAIYNHIGLSMSQGYSEGVLLLPEADVSGQDTIDGISIASLLAVLWRVRRIRPENAKAQKAKKAEATTPTTTTTITSLPVDEDSGVKKSKSSIIKKVFGVN